MSHRRLRKQQQFQTTTSSPIPKLSALPGTDGTAKYLFIQPCAFVQEKIRNKDETEKTKIPPTPTSSFSFWCLLSERANISFLPSYLITLFCVCFLLLRRGGKKKEKKKMLMMMKRRAHDDCSIYFFREEVICPYQAQTTNRCRAKQNHHLSTEKLNIYLRV